MIMKFIFGNSYSLRSLQMPFQEMPSCKNNFDYQTINFFVITILLKWNGVHIHRDPVISCKHGIDHYYC